MAILLCKATNHPYIALKKLPAQDSKSVTLSIELRGRATRIILENEIIISSSRCGDILSQSPFYATLPKDTPALACWCRCRDDVRERFSATEGSLTAIVEILRYAQHDMIQFCQANLRKPWMLGVFKCCRKETSDQGNLYVCSWFGYSD